MGKDGGDETPPGETAVFLVGGTICILLVSTASGDAAVARWGPAAFSYGAWTAGAMYALAVGLSRLGVHALYRPRPSPSAALQVDSANAMRPMGPAEGPHRAGLIGRLSRTFDNVPVRLAAAAVLAAPLSWSLIRLATGFQRPSDWLIFVGGALPLTFLSYTQLDAWARQGKN